MRISEISKLIAETVKFNMSLPADAPDAAHIALRIEGDPSLGKTAVVKQAASLIDNCQLNDKLNLAVLEPNDVAGWTMAEGDSMKVLRPHWMDWDMDDDRPFIIAIDEFKQGGTPQQNACARIVYERAINGWPLPKHATIIVMANKDSNKAGTTRMPTHLRDRLVYVTMEAHLDDAISYFNSVGVDYRINGYLRSRPDMLSQFDRDADACPSPRAWHGVSSLLKLELPETVMQQAIAGRVGQGGAADFMGYLRLVDVMPDPDELIANPKVAAIPEDPAITYAVTAALSYRMTDKNAEAIITYLNRLPQQEFAAFCSKAAVSRNVDLKRVQAVREWAKTNGKLLVL